MALKDDKIVWSSVSVRKQFIEEIKVDMKKVFDLSELPDNQFFLMNILLVLGKQVLEAAREGYDVLSVKDLKEHYKWGGKTIKEVFEAMKDQKTK